MPDADLVRSAAAGDREALESLIRAIQDKVYALALRMLWHPEDARDATQEILLRVVTHLSSYRHESAFMTWVYRLATNALLNFRKSRLELEGYDFERFGNELDHGLSPGTGVENAVLIEEIKIGCTLGMLTCLDRNHRLAYILGEILEFDSPEAAEILEISPASFRQRLSRARKAVIEFTRRKCGLVNSGNPCRCERRVSTALETGRMDASRLLFANQAGDVQRASAEIRKLDETRRIAAVYRSHPEFRSPEDFRRLIGELI